MKVTEKVYIVISYSFATVIVVVGVATKVTEPIIVKIITTAIIIVIAILLTIADLIS